MTILTRAEQEYLLRTIESGMALLDRRQLFLWAQGPLQALLPQDVLLCIGLDGSGRVLRVECLHRAVLDAAALERLQSDVDGAGVAKADLVIEAIFENLEAKQSHLWELMREEAQAADQELLDA